MVTSYKCHRCGQFYDGSYNYHKEKCDPNLHPVTLNQGDLIKLADAFTYMERAINDLATNPVPDNSPRIDAFQASALIEEILKGHNIPIPAEVQCAPEST